MPVLCRFFTFNSCTNLVFCAENSKKKYSFGTRLLLDGEKARCDTWPCPPPFPLGMPINREFSDFFTTVCLQTLHVADYGFERLLLWVWTVQTPTLNRPNPVGGLTPCKTSIPTSQSDLSGKYGTLRRVGVKIFRAVRLPAYLVAERPERPMSI